MLANYCVLLAATRLRPAREQRGSLSPHSFLIAGLVESRRLDARARVTWDAFPERCVGELPFEVTRPAIEARQSAAAAHESRVLNTASRAKEIIRRTQQASTAREQRK